MARARTLWEEGTESGRRVRTLGFAATLTIAILDILVNGDITVAFDLVFVAICVAMALWVRQQDFFLVGVLPPLLMLAVFWLVGLASPGTIAHSRDGSIQAAITGLAGHSAALLVGYALCLACLSIRQKVIQDTKRAGSPAPRRRISGAPSE